MYVKCLSIYSKLHLYILKTLQTKFRTNACFVVYPMFGVDFQGKLSLPGRRWFHFLVTKTLDVDRNESLLARLEKFFLTHFD